MKTERESLFAAGDAKSIYALFSGGHDSLCSTALAAKHALFRGVE